VIPCPVPSALKLEALVALFSPKFSPGPLDSSGKLDIYDHPIVPTHQDLKDLEEEEKFPL
jgi:hypothetical protein